MGAHTASCPLKFKDRHFPTASDGRATSMSRTALLRRSKRNNPEDHRRSDGLPGDETAYGQTGLSSWLRICADQTVRILLVTASGSGT